MQMQGLRRGRVAWGRAREKKNEDRRLLDDQPAFCPATYLYTCALDWCMKGVRLQTKPFGVACGRRQALLQRTQLTRRRRPTTLTINPLHRPLDGSLEPRDRSKAI